MNQHRKIIYKPYFLKREKEKRNPFLRYLENSKNRGQQQVFNCYPYLKCAGRHAGMQI